MFVARYWRTKAHLYKLTGVRSASGSISIVPRPETEAERLDEVVAAPKAENYAVVPAKR
jgi:hypothetical protein